MIMKSSDNQKLIHDINLIMNRLDTIRTNIKIIDDYDEKLSIIINNDIEDIRAKVVELGDVLDTTVEYVELKHNDCADD